MVFVSIEAGILDTTTGVQFLLKYVVEKDVLTLNFFSAQTGVREFALPPRAVKTLSTRPLVSISINVVATYEQVEKGFASSAHSSALNIANLETQEDIELLSQISLRGTLLRDQNWLILGNPALASSNNASVYLPADNKVAFAEASASNTTVTLYDVYQATRFTQQHVRAIGRYSVGKGLYLNVQDATLSRTNLTGLHLRCLTLPQAPFTYITNAPDGTAVIERGHVADVWRILQNTLGFTYTCWLPSDPTWGTTRDGKWTGMVGAMLNREADVIVAPLDNTVERAGVVTFTIGLRNTASRMVIKSRALMDSTWTTFTHEFTKEAWGGTLALMFLAPPFLAFVTHFSPSERERISLKDAYVISVGALAYQGASVETTSSPGRIVMIVIFFGTLLTYCHYTSALVASLTVASTTLPVESLQDVIESGSYELGITSGTSLEGEFQHSKTSPFKEAWETLIKPHLDDMPTVYQQGIDRAAAGSYAYVLEESVYSYEFSHDCRVTPTPPRYFISPTGFAFQHDSPYVKIFNHQLLRMRNSGILDRSWEQFQPPKDLCQSSDVVSLNPTQVFTAFLLLMVGAGLALLMLPVEKLCWNTCHKKKEEEDPIPPHLGWAWWE
ncbi:Ionotropic glutamate receptor L-glutamate and glycine-binding domain [Trinorchestia longiramus]|nr:Ionotropic glutamate receptor L-glutamate and glycine-binding domain [Trinorchestia longiramus]